MITEDKVTEIFCIADDFCTVTQVTKYYTYICEKIPYSHEKVTPGRLILDLI